MVHQVSGQHGDNTLDTRDAVAGKGKRKGRKRTREATTVRRIHAKARERQAAWLDGGPREPMWLDGQPYRRETYELTRELDALYGEHRDDQAGSLTDPYRGRTWRPR